MVVAITAEDRGTAWRTTGTTRPGGGERGGAGEGDEVLGHGAVVCGEADVVAERIAEIRDVIGVDHFLSWTRLGGLPRDEVIGHMGRMRDQVMPELR